MKWLRSVIVGMVLVATACSSSGPDTTAPTGDAAMQPLDWAPCAVQPPGGAVKECTTLTVPLDHAEPDGDTIEIAVARVASAGDDRIGSLVFNPGGPGGSGIEFLDQANFLTPVDVAERFDLVSFDPRGVGASTAATCDIEIDDTATLVAEGDDAAFQALIDQSAADLAACTAETLRIAPYLGTDNAARDLDMLRAALGDEGLTFVGYSYGTRLGATYAELFPDNVRALVLDGAVKPTDDFHELSLGQADGFDRALTNFAEACDNDEDCLLREIGPTLDVIAGLRTEITEVGTFPTDDDSRVLTPGEFDLGIIAALYSKEAWPFLAQGLYTAEIDQDGTLLQVLGDGLSGRRPDGTYDNSNVANLFINCADSPDRHDVDTVRAEAEETAARSEFFGDALRADTGCLGVAASVQPLTLGSAAGAAPILVIGNSGDPATPFEWSVALADFLDTAELYTVEAEGHTAYGSIECVESVVDAYLIDLEMPEPGAGCSDVGDADFFVPAGSTEVELLVAVLDCFRDNGVDIPPIGVADILADPMGEGFADFLDPSDPAVFDAAQACTEQLFAVQGA